MSRYPPSSACSHFGQHTYACPALREQHALLGPQTASHVCLFPWLELTNCAGAEVPHLPGHRPQRRAAVRAGQRRAAELVRPLPHHRAPCAVSTAVAVLSETLLAQGDIQP